MHASPVLPQQCAALRRDGHREAAGRHRQQHVCCSRSHCGLPHQEGHLGRRVPASTADLQGEAGGGAVWRGQLWAGRQRRSRQSHMLLKETWRYRQQTVANNVLTYFCRSTCVKLRVYQNSSVRGRRFLREMDIQFWWLWSSWGLMPPARPGVIHDPAARAVVAFLRPSGHVWTLAKRDDVASPLTR